MKRRNEPTYLPKRFEQRHRILVLIWVAFLARGAFYCVQQPMWEGFDEWAHFAYIQHLVENGAPPSRSDPIGDEVRRSLESVPLSSHAAMDVPGAITHDQFWKIARAERTRDSFALAQYEAQQPPLYYWLSTIPYSAFEHQSLPARVLALRLFSVAVASVVI